MARTALINGQRYKIGLYGWVFVKRSHGWALTHNVSRADVSAALKKINT